MSLYSPIHNDSCGACDGGFSCVEGACVEDTVAASCEAPLVGFEVPFEDSGTTVGGVDANSVALANGGCPGVLTDAGSGSSEVVYEFVVPATDTYTFTVASDEFDSVPYVVTGCGQSPTREPIIDAG